MLYKLILLALFFPNLTMVSAQKTTAGNKQKRSAVISQTNTVKVDAYVRKQMTENQVPVLSLAVVRDEKIILTKRIRLLKTL